MASVSVLALAVLWLLLFSPQASSSVPVLLASVLLLPMLSSVLLLPLLSSMLLLLLASVLLLPVMASVLLLPMLPLLWLLAAFAGSPAGP